MSASSYLPGQTSLSQTSATPCPSWSWVSTGGKGWSWNKELQPKRAALFAHGVPGMAPTGSGVWLHRWQEGCASLLLGCSTSPCSAVLHPSFLSLSLLFCFFSCVSTHVWRACVCAHMPVEAGGHQLSSVTSHFSLLSLLLVCMREIGGGVRR